MKLNDLNSLFHTKAITKSEYIDRMFDRHKSLFEYAQFISHTDVSKIEIKNAQVIFTIRAVGEEIQLVCAPDDKRSTPIDTLNFGQYEPAETKIMLSLIKENTVSLDIGANIGFYSILIARRSRKGRVFAFEPIPTTYRMLQTHIELNGISNIETYNFGFSEIEQEVNFYFTPHLSAAASLSNIISDSSVEEVTGRVKKLDDWIKEKNPIIDFIKCDVEGAELLVFRGGLNTIRTHQPIIFSELLRKWAAKFGYHPDDIINLLSPLGYNCYGIGSQKLSQIKNVQENTEETNFLFFHRKKHQNEIGMLKQEGLL